MKQLLLSFAALTASAALAVPELVGFTSVQPNPNSKVMTSFTLAGEAVLTVDVLTNGVTIGWRNFRGAMTGAALNRVNPAGDYTITWDPAESWPMPQAKLPGGMVTLEVRAWSPDNPPDLMDIDLTQSKSVAYYLSDDDLPLPVTNDLYKTTHLLMRRIHAAHKVWLMGSPANEGGRPVKNVLETQHPVCLSHDYYMGVYELTQGQYASCGLTVPDGQSAVGDRHPVANFSFDTLHHFWDCWWPDNGHKVGSTSVLAAFRQKTGVEFDLPTEDQWEFACRAGTTTAYCDGTSSSSSLGNYAIYKVNAPTNAAGEQICAEVGTKAPNGFGLYDMIGNVSEYCREQQASNLGSEYVCDPLVPVISKDFSNCHLGNRGSNYSNPVSSWSDLLGANVQVHRSAHRGDYYKTMAGDARAIRGVRFVAPVSRAWPTVDVADGTAAQDSSRRVAVTYALESDAIVTLELYDNGVRVSDEAIRAVCGDVNRIVKADGKKKCIYWQPDASWEGRTVESGRLSFNVRMWATNDPPAYMALDLTRSNWTNVTYYASAEAMPEPITNDVWKTDYLVMRRIPAKDVTWWMGIATNAAGKSVEDVGYDVTDSKRHRVKFSQDYYMSVFELTCRQARVFESTISAVTNAANWTKPYSGKWLTLRYDGGKGFVWPTTGHQVYSGSQLQKFRTRFNLQFDYPTDAQWEYACRAGYDGRYHGLGHLECAWTTSNTTELMPVGLLKPNAWGLYDMLGNAYEYCLDRYDVSYGLTDEQLASETPLVDPYGPVTTSNNYKIMRGGSYKCEAYICRSGDRSQSNHWDSNWGRTGFRLVCPLPGEVFAEPVLPTAE